MYAIIETGGKQYKVQKNDILAVEKLSARGGDKVQFNTVLLTGGKEVRVGDPLVKGAGVQATVIDQIKDKKVISFVKRRRKSSSKRKKGHRQQITLLKITDILESGADKTDIQEQLLQKGPMQILGIVYSLDRIQIFQLNYRKLVLHPQDHHSKYYKSLPLGD